MSPSNEIGDVDSMDDGRFQLLLDVLKVLGKNEDPNVVESALEIVENYSGNLSQDQKAEVFKEVMHLKVHRHEEDRERRFQDEWKKLQMRDFFRQDFY